MKLYLAGPMTGYAEFNHPLFHDAAYSLRHEGHDVFSPAEHDNDLGIDTTGKTGHEKLEEFSAVTLNKVLGDDLQYICHEAEGLAMLPGWENSRGARAEVATALALGKPVRTVAFWLGALSFAGDPAKDITEVPQMGAQGSQRGVLPPPSEMMGTETRVTSDTGGQKGRKPVSLAKADVLPLIELGKVNEYGSRKYAAYNYLKGYPWSDSFDALERHLLAFQLGEDVDPESGCLHLAHAMWHCAALISFYRRGIGTDDRYKGE